MEILELRNTIFREYVVLSSKLNYLAYWFTVYFIWETWVWCLLKIEYVLIEGYRGAWWAAVHVVAKAQKLLSTHSPNAEIALEVKFFIYKKATSCCLNNQIWSKLLYLSASLKSGVVIVPTCRIIMRHNLVIHVKCLEWCLAHRKYYLHSVIVVLNHIQLKIDNYEK